MEPVAYKNYRIFYNEHIKMFCLTEVRYNGEGKVIGIPNPLALLGESLEEVEETLEGLLSDVKNWDKEILTLDNFPKVV